MYRFNTNVKVFTHNIEAGNALVEWYLDFDMTTQGINGFRIHIPVQEIKIDKDVFSLKSVSKKYYDVEYKMHNFTIKPSKLYITDDNGEVWFE